MFTEEHIKLYLGEDLGDSDHTIIIDNCAPAQLSLALIIIGDKHETATSGDIYKDTIRSCTLRGVDFMSAGALAHQIKSLGLSF